MSLRTFTENVINLAVENCLVCDVPDILTTREVAAMDDARLTELAAESEEVKKRRHDLAKEVKVLREGSSECQKHRVREMTRT
jgi:uncharacterized coiled-coil DUF342 family protein